MVKLNSNLKEIKVKSQIGELKFVKNYIIKDVYMALCKFGYMYRTINELEDSINNRDFELISSK